MNLRRRISLLILLNKWFPLRKTPHLIRFLKFSALSFNYEHANFDDASSEDKAIFDGKTSISGLKNSKHSVVYFIYLTTFNKSQYTGSMNDERVLWSPNN